MINMKKFDKVYNQIITEARFTLSSLKPVSRKTPDIEEVKAELLKLFKCNSWEEFIDIQSPGQCDFISKAVCRLFPKFKMVSVFVKISQEAKKVDPGLTHATHFLNKLNSKYYDFGKGSNCYDGVYVLEGLGNKYDVNVTEEESFQFYNEIEVDPKEIGTIVR